jgi:Viral BACON domain
MNWVRAIAGVLVLWSSPAWSATLMWNANTEPDLAGYRVYQCSQLPCTRTSGNASLLATLGTVTSFNIGTPALTQYYVITAYDFANNESIESLTATFTPVVTPPPAPPPPVAPPPSVPSAIGASPTSLAFAATQGVANSASQTLNISNTGGGTLTWTASDNAAWLTLSPASGTGNGVISVSVATGSLAVGTYTGTITLSASGATSVSVPVTLLVASASEPPPATLRPPPAPSSLRITAAQ